MALNSPEKMLYFRVFPALMAADEAYMGLDISDDGVLFRLLRHQCTNGSIPADPDLLARVLVAEPADVRQFLSRFHKLRTLAELEGGPEDRLAVPYLHRERCEVLEMIQAKRAAGAKGGRSTQAKVKRGLPSDLGERGSALPRFEATLEHESSEQDQEEHPEQKQTNKHISTQASTPAPQTGLDAAAAGALEQQFLPMDLQEALAALGIAKGVAKVLCKKAGSPRALRAALELLEMKRKEKEIHSPAGFLLKFAPELAQEALAQYEKLLSEASVTSRGALQDPRWQQLPEECRESLAILRKWLLWWHQENRGGPEGKDVSTSDASRQSRNEFLDACLSHHPDRMNLTKILEEKVEEAKVSPTMPGIRSRVRYNALEQLLGVKT